MRPPIVFLMIASFASAASAQIAPIPSNEDPRLQTVAYRPGESIQLVTYPNASLALLFQVGEQVRQVVLSDTSAFRVSVTGANDSLSVQALQPAATAGMTVETSRRRYNFTLETSEGAMAAYAVRFVDPEPDAGAFEPPAPDGLIGQYKISGSKRLRPATIADDGERTYIGWGKYQALPAVFGVGPTGQEEVVDGYMRSDIFTIDRVYQELVLRIDKERATVRRTSKLAETEG